MTDGARTSVAATERRMMSRVTVEMSSRPRSVCLLGVVFLAPLYAVNLMAFFHRCFYEQTRSYSIADLLISLRRAYTARMRRLTLAFLPIATSEFKSATRRKIVVCFSSDVTQFSTGNLENSQLTAPFLLNVNFDSHKRSGWIHIYIVSCDVSNPTWQTWLMPGKQPILFRS